MNRFNLIIFFIWLVAGLLTLFGGDISIFNYATMWFTLMIYLFTDVFKV